jgi:hypothetical protein
MDKLSMQARQGICVKCSYAFCNYSVSPTMEPQLTGKLCINTPPRTQAKKEGLLAVVLVPIILLLVLREHLILLDIISIFIILLGLFLLTYDAKTQINRPLTAISSRSSQHYPARATS